MDMDEPNLTIKELIALLISDDDLYILFVEGKRDLAFWSEILPFSDRKNGVIYPISIIKIDGVQGGEKGRCIKVADLMINEGLQQRVKVFIDDDYDTLIGTNHPDNVITTDYKDIEAYSFEEKCLKKILKIGLAKESIEVDKIIDDLKNLCIPIGLIRVLSKKEKLNFPFQSTFKKNRRRKFITGSNCKIRIKIDKLVSTIIQNSEKNLSILDDIMIKLEKINDKLKDTDCRYIMHGKDWTYYFSVLLEIDNRSIEPMIFLAMDYDQIRGCEKISQVTNWLVK